MVEDVPISPDRISFLAGELELAVTSLNTLHQIKALLKEKKPKGIEQTSIIDSINHSARCIAAEAARRCKDLEASI